MAIRRSCRILLALACFTLTGQAAAQHAPAPGARVRVVDAVSAVPLVTGELVRVAGDTVVILSSERTATALVVAAGLQLELSAGTHRRTLRGIGLGFLVGAAFGAGLGLATYEEQPESYFDWGPGFAALGYAVVFSVPGMVIGGIVGANSKYEAWRRIDHRRIRVGVAPAGYRGVLLAASVAF